MSAKEQLLAYIVDASKPNISEQHPRGYCYVERQHAELAGELHNEELIQAMLQSPQADGSFPARPTDTGIKWNAAAGAPRVAPKPAPAPAIASAPIQAAPQSVQQVHNHQFEAGVPIPPKGVFGKVSTGVGKLELFGFDKMQQHESFYIGQPEGVDPKEKPILRTFSSTVSQANQRLHPKQFIIREWSLPDGAVGARVWRIEDREGPMPRRLSAAEREERQAAKEAKAAAKRPSTAHLPRVEVPSTPVMYPTTFGHRPSDAPSPFAGQTGPIALPPAFTVPPATFDDDEPAETWSEQEGQPLPNFGG